MSEYAARQAIARMNGRAIALSPHYTTEALSADLRHMQTANPDEQQKMFLARRDEMCAAFGMSSSEQRKPFAFGNGMAIIPITGSLYNRFNYSYSGATGYNFIRSQLRLAMADDDVKGIIYDVNSYGGEAAGCFELAADMRAAREIKPSLSMVDSNAYSAGYALGSSAGRIVAIPSAGIGSIGVIMMHINMKKMLDDFGLDITLIYEGERKAEGNPFEALSPETLKSWKADIHYTYERFVDLVATNMGIDAKIIRDTQSRAMRADEALSLGLIHAVASPSEAMQVFFDELSGSNSQPQQESKTMTGTTQPAADQKALDEQKAAKTAERARISGIQGCEEAKGRETLANHLAMNTEMSVDEAKTILGAAEKKPEAAAPAPAPAAASPAAPGAPVAKAKTGFEQHMDTTDQPNITGEGGGGGDGNDKLSMSQQILRDQALATGVDYKKS